MNTQKLKKHTNPTADRQKVLFSILCRNQSSLKQSRDPGGEKVSEESFDTGRNVFVTRKGDAVCHIKVHSETDSRY